MTARAAHPNVGGRVGVSVRAVHLRAHGPRAGLVESGMARVRQQRYMTPVYAGTRATQMVQVVVRGERTNRAFVDNAVHCLLATGAARPDLNLAVASARASWPQPAFVRVALRDALEEKQIKRGSRAALWHAMHCCKKSAP